MSTNIQRTSAVGSIISALLASVCCIGPVVFALLGAGSVGLTSKFEQYRPLFIGVTTILLGISFYFTYKKKPAEQCTPGSYCANPKSDKINKIILWISTTMVIFFVFFPAISAWLLN